MFLVMVVVVLLIVVVGVPGKLSLLIVVIVVVVKVASEKKKLLLLRHIFNLLSTEMMNPQIYIHPKAIVFVQHLIWKETHQSTGNV